MLYTNLQIKYFVIITYKVNLLQDQTYVYKNTDGSLTNNKSTIQSIDYIENYMKSMKSALQNIENPNKDLIAPIINVKVTYLEKIKHNYNLSDRKKIDAWINDLKNTNRFLLYKIYS